MDQLIYERTAMRPTGRAWAKHSLLLLITFCTATIAGTLYPFGLYADFPMADPQSLHELFEMVLALPSNYLLLISDAVVRVLTNFDYLKYGLSFSLSLIFILVSHEMGHYIACRVYGVDATLPYFIPTPPLIGPAGTFGAFIRILSPMPSRRAVFDIGVAGPIAGFAALIPVAILGIATMQTMPIDAPAPEGAVVFADPLMMRLIASVYGVDLQFGFGNAFYFAAWVGLLVTALNLIPSGQLDGGHALYAVFGASVHHWTGRIAFATMATLSVIGWFFYNSPSGFLMTILLAIMMRVPHPEPWDNTPLDSKRILIAILVLVMFVVCFVPFPIRIT
ncbi:MAG: site-2 protease family protein [Acidobacteria bacterium]|nr:site-2 protease family protein [Acidobacteriota bacterium]